MNLSTDKSDAELLRLYLDTGNAIYFECLHAKYSILIFNNCYSILKDESLAEDATQEIFLKILVKFSTFKGNSKLSTWIYRVTNNHCIDELKKEKRQIISWEDNLMQYEGRSKGTTYEFFADQSNHNHMISSVFENIQSHYKSILLMKYEENLSIQEICTILNKSESATKMQIKRARKKFKKLYLKNSATKN